MPATVDRAVVDDFLAQRTLALAGVSRSGKGFGNVIRKELTAKGYRVLVVHPEAVTADGQPCARSLEDVASEVGGLVLVTPPAATATLVREAAAAGIRRVWMQQGAESDEALRFCADNGLAVVHHECILMFAEPAGPLHRFHRWLRGLLGRLPTAR
jgi:uncharacterized protein